MDLKDSLRIAVEHARSGEDGLLEYSFNTRQGSVIVLADVTLDGDTIICGNLCVYAASDPPGIKKSTIMRELLTEFSSIRKAAHSLGYAQIYVQGLRTIGSSSANVGKLVDVRRRSKQ